jgi:predicted esterase
LGPESETHIRLVSLPSFKTKTYSFHTSQEARDISASPRSGTFAILTFASKYAIEICEQQGSRRVLVSSPNEISSLHWTRTGKSLIYEETTDYGVIYQTHSASLPSVAAQHLSITAGALNAAAWIWRSPARARAIIIRVHGSNVREVPVWQDDIQVALSEGIDYVALDFLSPPKGDYSTVAKEIEIVASYAIKSLHIPSSRVVLLGYSSGANIALVSALRRPELFGFVVLVGPTAIPVFSPQVGAITAPFALQLFQSQEDINSFPSAEGDLRDVFHKAGLDMVTIKKSVLSDTHLMTKPTSWAAVYTEIFQHLGLSCLKAYRRGSLRGKNEER